MQKNNNCPKQDIVVNFKDLCLYILLRWRSILVCILVFTILAGGFKYLMDYRAYKSNVAATEQTDASVPNLTDIELSNAKTVLAYKNMMVSQATYIAQSPYMQLNPNAIYSTNISLVLSGNDTVSAATLYAKHMQSDTLYNAIKTKLNLPYAASYLSEVITVSVDYPENIVVETGDKAVLNILVYATSEEKCKAMVSAVTEYVATFDSHFKNAGITVSKPYTDYAVICNADIVAQQQKAMTTFNTYKKNYQDGLDALTDAERTYYDRLLNADIEASDIAAPSVSKKFLVLGFALGLILPCGIYLLAYLFGRRVKSAEDFALRYGTLNVFGSIPGGKKKNGLDRLIVKIVCGYSAKQDFDGLLSRKAAVAIEQNGYKNICVVGSNNTTTAVIGVLDNSGAHIAAADLPETDADAFEAVTNADAVIIAARVGETYYNEVYGTLDICEAVGKPVLGAIVVE